MRLDQAELLEVAGERGLGNAKLLRGEAAAQLFLIGNARAGDQPEDLAVPKCFGGIHGGCNYAAICIFIQAPGPGVNTIFATEGLMQDSTSADASLLDFQG